MHHRPSSVTLALSLAAAFLLAGAPPAAGQTGTWSGPLAVTGQAKEGTGAFFDRNSRLFLTTHDVVSAGPNSGRPFIQEVQNSTVGTAQYFPLVTGFTSQGGDLLRGAQDPDGDMIMAWNAGDLPKVPVMQWRGLDGTWGPAAVGIGDRPVSMACRNGRLVVLFVSNTLLRVNEWTVSSNGTLTPVPSLSFVQTATSLSGGVVAIDADDSTLLIFGASPSVRYARRPPGGTWTVNPRLIDSVDPAVQSISQLKGRSSPGGRVIVSWRIQGKAPTTTDLRDYGFALRALVREPGADVPAGFVTLDSASPDLTSGAARRQAASDVAIGLDGTVAALSYTQVCGLGGTRLFSQGLLRVAGPAQDFATVASRSLSPLDSGEGLIPNTSAQNGVVINAFATENRRAVLEVTTTAKDGVGTDATPTCGPAAPSSGIATLTNMAIYYDGHTSEVRVQGIGELTRDLGSSVIPEGTYRRTMAAAMDAQGNAALIRSGAFPSTGNSDLFLYRPSTEASFTAWAATNIPAGQSAAFDADWNRDGILNGVAYVFGSTRFSPTGKGRVPAPPAIPTDVNLFLDRSTTLAAGSWTPVASWVNGAAPVFVSGVSLVSGEVRDTFTGPRASYRYRVVLR